ncbi:Predicted DNA-binding protein with PD1-like DNA-binding motif [Thermosyntropha lipolytica DSM 11003]|uniref:Predicted DNA-binding protein with PD1-like DNA-binding motif n=1 Tax=Thermosyntropha lipolytica DSM 11003 TaxID=1123382 RepID=A0A1M5L6C1_9FIRM|nr:DUF296 domain-containing protein [Thermosyntropha lipolytica]SHG60548.1 Predicted DNA-binding protein with PD1-like DNA-binding motif [Thermosyntropha lipolytica DSM 11003]
MKYQEGQIGRVFVVNFEHGDDIIKELKALAENKNISSALVVILGALQSGHMVVGPQECTIPPLGLPFTFTDGREVLGIGTLFKGEDKKPSLHMHVAVGREDKVRVGCLRKDAEVYLTIEAVILELNGLRSMRAFNEEMQINLLTFNK